MRALVVTAVVAVLGTSAGCSHMIAIESTPAGASVLVDGAFVGTTPLVIEEKTGRDDLVAVEVQRGESSARFAYQKSGVASDAAIGAAAAGCGMCGVGAGGLVALVIVIPTIALVAADPALAVGLVIGATVAYTLGVMLITYAPYAAIIGIGEGARKGPERIHVDFAPAVPLVSTTPDGMTIPLVGHTRRAAPQQRY